MGNIYVGQFRDILKGYYRKQKEYNAKIVENNKRFSPEYAEKENKQIREQQTQSYNEAKASIDDVFSTVRTLLANANFLNVESLTADRLFFETNSGFDLSADEVRSYVERYSDNFTMLRLIKDWIAKHDTHTKEYPAGKYADIKITMPIDVLQAYKQFSEGALAVVDKIYGNGTIMQDMNYDNGAIYTANEHDKKEKREYPLEIEAFGNEEFAGSLLAIVGDGMHLSDYKNSRVPETAQHAFDSVVPAGTDTNYYVAR